MPVNLQKLIHPYQQKGVGLLEALISMVVLSVGIIGIAQLQFRSLRANHNSFLSTKATLIAYNAFDKIRVNKAKIDSVIPDGSTYMSVNHATLTGKNCYLLANCTDEEFAQFDMYFWSATTQSDDSLPSGRAEIKRNGSVYTITVTWTERSMVEGQAAQTRSLTYKSEI